MGYRIGDLRILKSLFDCLEMGQCHLDRALFAKSLILLNKWKRQKRLGNDFSFP